MDNLSFENIAIGAGIVGVLNLIIVTLVKTETILKYVEKIKGVIGLDYKDRAKRSDDELRISKKHSLVARERVRNSFITMDKWRCKWVWNWDDDLHPINIKGYCTGDTYTDLGYSTTFKCDHPVEPYYYFPIEETNESDDTKKHFRRLGITCLNDTKHYIHISIRESFDILRTISENYNSAEAFEPIITKAIIAERDSLIAKEIKILRNQFWR